MLSDLDLNELKWDHDGSYWYSRDSYNITPADMHEYARKLKAENARFREALRTIMFATTLPPDALMGDHAGFYRRELQRCIGDAARALDSQGE